MQEWLLQAFCAAPKVVERILRVFPHDRLDDRIERDRFTAREVIAHLADYEQHNLEAFRTVKLKPGSKIDEYCPDKQCETHSFGEKDVFREGEVFESRRLMTADLLRTFSPEDWNKTVLTQEGKEVTAKDILTSILAHDIEHLDQLSAYLATEVATLA